MLVPVPLEVLNTTITRLEEALHLEDGSVDVDVFASLVTLQAMATSKPLLLSSYQMRWTNPANRNDVHPSETAWQPVVPEPGQTMDQAVNAVKNFKWQGIPTYEIRPLYAIQS